jgi:hypothetical protein
MRLALLAWPRNGSSAGVLNAVDALRQLIFEPVRLRDARPAGHEVEHRPVAAVMRPGVPEVRWFTPSARTPHARQTVRVWRKEEVAAKLSKRVAPTTAASAAQLLAR